MVASSCDHAQGVARVDCGRRDRFPFAVALAGYPWGDVTVIAAVAVLVVVRHAANLKRLFRGEELGIDPGVARDDGDS